MANAVYPKYKEALLDGSANIDINDLTVKVGLYDTSSGGYDATDVFLTDVASTLVGTPQTLANTTVTSGLFDADDVTFTAVSGASVEALIIYIDTGSGATSRVVAYIDTATGLAVTPNGGNITVTWNVGGIFQL